MKQIIINIKRIGQGNVVKCNVGAEKLIGDFINEDLQ